MNADERVRVCVPIKASKRAGQPKGFCIMKRFLATAALLATAISAPASAVTLVANFTDVGAATSSVTKSNISLGVTVSARRFSLSAGTFTNDGLTNISSFMAPVNAAVSITRQAGGLGVVAGGVSNSQMDTNTANSREAFLVTGTDTFRLKGLRLTQVDMDDTLQVYGVGPGGVLTNIGYGTGFSMTSSAAVSTSATIVGGAGGTLLNNIRTAANGGTNDFGLANQLRFGSYIITTRVGGQTNFLGTPGQGFGLQALTAVVPEPATWGLMIVGFGMVGVAARRRNRAVVA